MAVNINTPNTPVPFTLQFNCGSTVVHHVFEISIVDPAAPIGPQELIFEIVNAGGTAQPNWGVWMQNQDWVSFVELWTNGTGSAEPPAIPINPVAGGASAGPFDTPPPDSWLWSENELQIYFKLECSGGDKVPAANDHFTAAGIVPGSPLRVTVNDVPLGGKKVKVLLPGGPIAIKAETTA